MKTLSEFTDILGVDFVYDDSGDPIRIEYLWSDEE